MNKTPKQIAEEVLEACRKATPAPWHTERYDAENGYIHFSVNDEHMQQVAFCHEDMHPKTFRKDAELIALLRNNAEFLARAVLKLEEENEKLKARFCSHGDYQVWGTNDCNECDDGRITLYYFSGLCVECEHKALSKVTGGK